MSNSVLAHLAAAIPQKENLATEALAFIANKSPAARDALAKEFARFVDGPLVVKRLVTQEAVGAESRPDIVLLGDAGKVLGFVEAKFWAALTAAQPVQYVKRLTEAGGGVLMMLAPERRLGTLRQEVLERCRRDGLSAVPQGAWSLKCGTVSIGFIAWNRVLNALKATLAGDAEALSDVHQLEGLCARFESEGFLPLTSVELDNLDAPRLVLALAHLVNDIAAAGVAAGVLEIDRLRAFHGPGGSGRYVAFAHAGCWMGLTCRYWIKYGCSPLWLHFRRGSWGRADQIRELFRPWASEDPPRAFLDDDQMVCIPLRLTSGVEKDRVVADAVKQLREVDATLRAAGLSLLSGEPPTET